MDTRTTIGGSREGLSSSTQQPFSRTNPGLLLFGAPVLVLLTIAAAPLPNRGPAHCPTFGLAALRSRRAPRRCPGTHSRQARSRAPPASGPEYTCENPRSLSTSGSKPVRKSENQNTR